MKVFKIENKEITPELMKMLKSVPFMTKEEQAQIKPGKLLASGRAEAQEFLTQLINKGGRPVVDNPKKVMSVRLEEKDVKYLRSKGKGWQAKVRNYISQGIASGNL